MADATSLVLYDLRTADRKWSPWSASWAGCAGRTREAYALDQRQCLAWCSARQLRLFDAHRTDIELYARDLGEHGRARATIAVACRPSPALPLRGRGRPALACGTCAPSPPRL